MLSQILTDTTLTNADFMAVKMLQEGALAGKWLGFNWIAYEKLDLTPAAGTDPAYKTTVAWCKTAAHLGTGQQFGTDIGPRRDKNNTIQISVDASYGAAGQTRARWCPSALSTDRGGRPHSPGAYWPRSFFRRHKAWRWRPVFRFAPTRC